MGESEESELWEQTKIVSPKLQQWAIERLRKGDSANAEFGSFRLNEVELRKLQGGVVMHVYLNYPNPHITIHKDSSCGQIHMHHKQKQRRISINMVTLRFVLADFINDKYVFKAEKLFNDLWLDINLDTPEQELGFVHVIQAIIGQRYAPFSDAPVIEHC